MTCRELPEATGSVPAREQGQDVMNDEPVPIPREVRDGIEAVRLSGLTNMLDRPRVAEIAEQMGLNEPAAWVRANRDVYAQAVFHGFEAQP